MFIPMSGSIHLSIHLMSARASITPMAPTLIHLPAVQVTQKIHTHASSSAPHNAVDSWRTVLKP
jgi:hypothetical protein